MQAELRPHNGAITLFINGQAQPSVAYKSTEMPDDKLFEETVRKTVAEVAWRGVHVHLVPIFFGWTGPGVYDFSRMDWRIQQVLQADPQAWLIVRIQARSMAPEWWMEAHPEAVSRFGFSSEVTLPRPTHQTSPAPSLGSNFWDEAGIPALEALAQHIQNQPYASRLIGYLPTAYNTNEWYFRDYDALQVNDLCPAMQTAFSAWLQKHYAMDGRVPDRVDRHHPDRRYLFDPDPRRSHAPVTAFYQFYNNLCAETIVKICQALKRIHAPDRILTGTFYGYSLELAQFHWLADSGHLDLARLLEEDGPDFTCSPLTYFTRNPHDLPAGGWVWSLSPAVDSARLHGKGFYGEDDFLPPNGQGLSAWAGAQTPAEDVETMRRNFAFALCKGQNQWWYDLVGHQFDSPQRLEVIEQCTQIAFQAIEHNRASVADTAVILDEKAPMAFQLDMEFQRGMFWENFFHSFARIGAPVDLFLRSDLGTADLRRYKAIFFPTCFSLTAMERTQIHSLKTSGRTLVFYQADGFIDPQAAQPFAIDRLRELSGMNIHTAEAVQHSFLRLVTGRDHPLLAGFEDQPFGVPGEKTLNFYIDDPATETLATFNGLGAAGMARRIFPDWTSIYCAVPVMDAALVHNIIRAAGAHLYTSERSDIVYACSTYIVLFTRSGGMRTLFLPQPSQVSELFHGVVKSDRPVSQITWGASAYTTYLFQR